MKHIQWVASMCLLFYSRMPLCLFVSVYVELDLIRNSQSVLPIGGGSSRLKACFESTDSQDAVSGPKEGNTDSEYTYEDYDVLCNRS